VEQVVEVQAPIDEAAVEAMRVELEAQMKADLSAQLGGVSLTEEQLEQLKQVWGDDAVAGAAAYVKEALNLL